MTDCSFGSSVIAGHGLPPVTAGIGVWLDGVGQAGMYRTAERMNGRVMLNYAGEAGDAGDARLRWCWCDRATAANWLIDVIDDTYILFCLPVFCIVVTM